MNTPTHHDDEAVQRVRSAGRGAVSNEAVASGAGGGHGTMYASLPQPTARQIADAVVRFIATGSRR